jgi:hypothetical protein
LSAINNLHACFDDTLVTWLRNSSLSSDLDCSASVCMCTSYSCKNFGPVLCEYIFSVYAVWPDSTETAV